MQQSIHCLHLGAGLDLVGTHHIRKGGLSLVQSLQLVLGGQRGDQVLDHAGDLMLDAAWDGPIHRVAAAAVLGEADRLSGGWLLLLVIWDGLVVLDVSGCLIGLSSRDIALLRGGSGQGGIHGMISGQSLLVQAATRWVL